MQRNLAWLAVGILIGGTMMIAALKLKEAREAEDFEALADTIDDKLSVLEDQIKSGVESA